LDEVVLFGFGFEKCVTVGMWVLVNGWFVGETGIGKFDRLSRRGAEFGVGNVPGVIVRDGYA